MSGGELRRGLVLGVAAFGMWGLVPVYFKAVASVPALEVLAHRVVWSVVMLAPLLVLQRQVPAAKRAVTGPTTASAAVRCARGRVVVSAITLAGRGAGTEAVALIGLLHMQRFTVGLGIHRDRIDVHLPETANDAGGDGPAVGNKHGFDHPVVTV